MTMMPSSIASGKSWVVSPSSPSEQSIPSDSTPREDGGVDLLAVGELGPVERRRHQLAGRDILGAGDNLDILARPDIHLADEQVIGIGVGGDAHKPADDDLLDRSSPSYS